MRISVLPLMFGFILLGALSHEAVARINGTGSASSAPATVPAPAQPANLPKQLRTAVGGDDADQPRDAGMAPLPAYVAEPGDDGCATCAWSI